MSLSLCNFGFVPPVITLSLLLPIPGFLTLPTITIVLTLTLPCPLDLF